jgi:L-ascorbate metabolism protein UlaG (beta-lactamase superfamily)
MTSSLRSALVVVLACFGSAGVTGSDRFPASGGDLEVTPFVHSSVQFEHAGKVVHVDPWSLGDLSRAKPADLVLVTDDVPHHLDVKAIAHIRKPGAPVVIPAAGKAKVPDGIVLANGEATTVAGVRVEAIGAYDLTPGEPYHPKGEANGYLLTLGGKRIFLAGVTECVPEIRRLTNLDIAFLPVNLPAGRMAPSAAAECVRAIRPKSVYAYHYDQDYAARLQNPRAARPAAAAASPAEQLQRFVDALKGGPSEFRRADWYPANLIQ